VIDLNRFTYEGLQPKENNQKVVVKTSFFNTRQLFILVFTIIYEVYNLFSLLFLNKFIISFCKYFHWFIKAQGLHYNRFISWSIYKGL
jgi:superfamily I DNA and/or RNA helicase